MCHNILDHCKKNFFKKDFASRTGCHKIGQSPCRSQETGKVGCFFLSFTSSGLTGRDAAPVAVFQRALAARVAVPWLSHVQPQLPRYFDKYHTHPSSSPRPPPPSPLSNKAMGHISEAFRGSLAHPLVSANHSCNWEPNLYRNFNQTPTAGSSRSWGGIIQLPQRHRPKQTRSWKLKHL